MEDLLEQAKVLYEKNALADSLDRVNQYMNASKGDINAFLLRARIHYRMQRWGDAINDYYSVLELDPRHKEATSGLEMTKNILGYFTPDMFNP